MMIKGYEDEDDQRIEVKYHQTNPRYQYKIGKQKKKVRNSLCEINSYFFQV